MFLFVSFFKYGVRYKVELFVNNKYVWYIFDDKLILLFNCKCKNED